MRHENIVVAGTEDFVDRLASWQTRLAGNLFTVHPFVLGAFHGLRTHLPRMAGYRERARTLAAVLAAEPGWHVAPEQPQVNAFQLHLPALPERLRAGMLTVAQRDGFWLGARAMASSVLEGGAMVEVVIGDAADGWLDAEALDAWRAAMVLARC